MCLQVCTLPAARGDLDVLQWLRSGPEPCPWDVSTFYNAARSGQMEVLRWLAAQQPPCPFDQETICTGAARSGRLEVLEFVQGLKPQPSLTVDTLKAAVKRLDLVQWLRAQDPPCPWSEEVCTAAASTGGLEVRTSLPVAAGASHTAQTDACQVLVASVFARSTFCTMQVNAALTQMQLHIECIAGVDHGHSAGRGPPCYGVGCSSEQLLGCTLACACRS